MNYFLAALQVEGLKVYKSKVIWVTAAAFTIAPLMAGFFMFVLKDPELAKSSGLVGAKAQIAGEATWSSYLGLHAQMIAVGGIMVFGFVMSWIFGREYADKTLKDLIALPYSRGIIVIAKFIAAFITSFILSVYITILGFLIGWMVGLPGWSIDVIADGLFVLFIVTILTIILSTPVAFLASFSRGYLAPLGLVVMTLVLSQIVATAGFGEYFPWAIPALYSGLIDGENIIHFSGIVIILLTSLIGVISTHFWWHATDQY